MVVPVEERAMERTLRVSRHSDSQAGSLRLGKAAAESPGLQGKLVGGKRNISQQPNWDLAVIYSKDFIK